MPALYVFRTQFITIQDNGRIDVESLHYGAGIAPNRNGRKGEAVKKYSENIESTKRRALIRSVFFLILRIICHMPCPPGEGKLWMLPVLHDAGGDGECDGSGGGGLSGRGGSRHAPALRPAIIQ